MTPKESNSTRMDTKTKIQRFEHTKPPFTLGEIKRAVPPHCFNRSLVRSFSYLFRDLAFVALFYYIATTYIPLIPRPLAALAWTLYWLCQGCMMFGVWVLGHECGHNAFSCYSWLDDIVGLIIHSALFTPYFSWKFSHKRHHLNTSSIERDEVYVPKLKTKRGWYHLDLDYLPIQVLGVLIRLTIGWYLYISFNMAGRKYDRFASHFDPYSPIFNDRERLLILVTDVGYIATIYAVHSFSMAHGVSWVMFIYGIPLIVTNMLMVTTTHLNHTHAAVPHYDSTEWEWLRGALATVDRNYGFILDHVFHNVMNTHVAHHLFSTLPHYNAMEATKAIKPVLGKYYNFDGTNMLKALWRESMECLYIEPDEDNKGVYWYSNKK